MAYVMYRVKIGNKAYIIGKIKEQVTLIRKEKVLSLIKASEIILRNFPRIIIKEHILKVKNNKTLQHQKAEIFLIIMLKIMNARDL